jgi:hypothetical protein
MKAALAYWVILSPPYNYLRDGQSIPNKKKTLNEGLKGDLTLGGFNQFAVD